MNEPTQETQETANVLIREKGPAKETPAPLYDAAAKNRFEFELKEDGLKYDIAFTLNPLDDDERYMQWMRDFKIKGGEQDVSEESTEASCRYFDDVVDSVEGIDFPPGADWKSLIRSSEKTDVMKAVLAVAISDPEIASKKPAFRASSEIEQVTIITECWFNGEVAQQKHVMRPRTAELEKKYARISGKRFKQENTRGLRRKPRVEYAPQDDKFGELYDQMKISATGFAGDVIPLRFKTTVVHEIFNSELDQKK